MHEYLSRRQRRVHKAAPTAAGRVGSSAATCRPLHTLETTMTAKKMCFREHASRPAAGTSPASPAHVQGLGFRVQGSGFGVQGSGFRISGYLGSRCQVPGSRCQVLGSRCQVPGPGFKVPGSRFQIQGSGFRAHHGSELRVQG